MTRLRFAVYLSVASLVGLMLCWPPALSHAGLFTRQSRPYGPTVPNGYTIRVDPQAVTLAHSQKQPIQVTVKDEAGQLVDGVTVHFRTSEGAIEPTTHTTQGGMVTGTFATANRGDDPRTAFIVVTVENVEVTVFIDIVPAVFGR